MKVLYMLNCEIVRTVCIDNNFYNAGSNEEYENMFSLVMKEGGTMNVEDIAEIAEDIVAHTHKSYNLTVEDVMTRLLNVARVVAVIR